MAAVMSEESSELACVLIPVGNTHLLLPNVTVAEILPWRRVKPLEDAPPWCLGLVGWRGVSIPVVRYELFDEAEKGTRRTGRCLTVMNRSRTRDGRAFYAIAADRIPRLIHIGAPDVATQSRPLGPADVMSVNVGPDEAIVPNLGFLEDSVKTLRF